MGDNLDRGTDEIAVLRLLRRMQREARAAGGAVHALLGNHELQNVMGDFRSVAGSEGFSRLPTDLSALPTRVASQLRFLSPPVRARAAALSPGGALAAGALSERNVALVVGRTLFVHGGLEPQRAGTLEQLNGLTRRWLRNNLSESEEREVVSSLFAEDAVVWSRRYSSEAVEKSVCDELRKTLATLSVDRMVVGHTPQPHGITSACGGAVWRVDTGMSSWFAGFTDREVQVLSIGPTGDVNVLREHGDNAGASDSRRGGAE